MRVRKKLLSLRIGMIIVLVAEHPRSSSRSSVKDPSGYGVLLAIAVMAAAVMVATSVGGREKRGGGGEGSVRMSAALKTIAGKLVETGREGEQRHCR